MKPGGYLRRGLKPMLLAFFAFLAGASPAGAQSPVYRVAVLTPGLTFGPVMEGLRDGLARLGYQEGRNVTFIVEETKGAVLDLPRRAAKLAETKPDVLFTVSTTHTTAAKQATTTVPIVFAWVGDPLRSGLIAGYSASKNNLTGVSSYAGPLSGKRLEILQDLAPGMKRILAVVATKDSIAESSFLALDEAAKKLGIRVLRRDVTTRDEIERVVRETAPGSVDGIFHLPSALVGVHIDLLIKKAKEDKIPLIVHEDTIVEQGALVSYGADFRLIGAQAGNLVARVLRGARPSELPIQTPEKLILAINLTTAKAIGLKLPRSLAERADRFFE